MKAFLRWLGKIIGSALTTVLVIVLFPYIAKFAAKILPDESGAAIKASMVIAERMEESARLETLRVEEEGVLNYDIQAAFVGSVANINVRYAYSASFGIDLSRVELIVTGNSLTFKLPYPEVLLDDLTPLETYRDDFWYPGFSDTDYNRLLETEKQSRRNVYLSGEKAAALQQTSIEVFERTVSSWLKQANTATDLFFEYAPLPIEEE